VSRCSPGRGSGWSRPWRSTGRRRQAHPQGGASAPSPHGWAHSGGQSLRARLSVSRHRRSSSAYSDAVLARAPASAANLGPGFDTVAVALDRYIEVEIEPASRLIVTSEGEGAGLSDDARHLAARVAMDVVGNDRLAIRVRSQIPIGRGLGSSAALAVAAAAAAGARDPLAIAAQADGHPENAAASVVGGLVVATKVRGAVRAVEMPLDPLIALVAIVPDRPLSTARARQALPHKVDLVDATFNLGRFGLLLAGLADHRMLWREAGEDRLHQDYRSPLFPEAPKLLNALVAAGALMACWSGAGPTLLGLTTVDAESSLRSAAERALAEAGVPGLALVLHPDRVGLVTGDAALLPPDERSGPPRTGGPSAPGAPPKGTGGVFDFDADA
jgi:homoserine kinase